MTTNASKVNSSAAKKNFITVATKTYDGGTKASNTSEPAAETPRKPVRKHEDAFMYYSHQETKMDALLLRNDENDDQVAQESIERKTRISFEIHPKLLLEDLFPVAVDVPEVRGALTPPASGM